METSGYAYSTLGDVLVKEHITVADIYARLVAKGFKFDKKTLYRLASHKPIQSISAPVVGALCQELKIDVGQLLVWDRPKPKLHRIDDKTQARLDHLMDKNTAGTLTAKENEEFHDLGEMVERLSYENAKILAGQTRPGRRAAQRRRPARAGEASR